MRERFWLRASSLLWQEATREQFIEAERRAGFRPKPGCGDIATGGFSGGSIQGRITSGEITEEKYGWDPEFLEVTQATT